MHADDGKIVPLDAEQYKKEKEARRRNVFRIGDVIVLGFLHNKSPEDGGGIGVAIDKKCLYRIRKITKKDLIIRPLPINRENKKTSEEINQVVEVEEVNNEESQEGSEG